MLSHSVKTGKLCSYFHLVFKSRPKTNAKKPYLLLCNQLRSQLRSQLYTQPDSFFYSYCAAGCTVKQMNLTRSWTANGTDMRCCIFQRIRVPVLSALQPTLEISPVIRSSCNTAASGAEPVFKFCDVDEKAIVNHDQKANMRMDHTWPRDDWEVRLITRQQRNQPSREADSAQS